MLKRKNRSIGISLIMTCGIFLLCYKTALATYSTNDDVCIQYLLSGVMTGEPYPLHPYINAILTYPIACLYSFFPNVPWWFIWCLVLIFTGVFFFHYYLLNYSEQRLLPVSIALLAIFDFAVVFYNLTRLNYSVVPAFLCVGLIAKTILQGRVTPEKTKLTALFMVIGSVLMICQRQESGVVAIFYLFLATLFFLTEEYDSKKKAIISFCKILLLISAIAAGLFLSNKLIQTEVNGEAYIQFNQARTEFMDYSHLGFNENSLLYEEQGWNQNIYTLVTRFWCFIDEHVSTEAFRILSGNEHSGNISFSAMKRLISSESRMILIVVWGLSFVLWLMTCICSFNKKVCFFGGLNTIGTIVLLVYIVWRGRINYRGIASFVIPSTAYYLCLFAVGIKNKSLVLPGFLVTIVILVMLPMTSRINYDPTWVRDSYFKMESEKELQRYATQHKEDFYITDLDCALLQCNPLNVYPDSKPSNVLFWGGYLYHSDAFYRQLENNGFSVLDGSIFRNINVHLLSGENILQTGQIDSDSAFVCFLTWMKQNNDAIGFVQSDVISDSFCVYDFVFKDDEHVEGFYDVVEENVVFNPAMYIEEGPM